MREQQGDWWCPTCKQALSGQRVTSAERCDTCGTPVCVAGTDQEAEWTWLREENGTLRATLADREARIAALEGVVEAARAHHHAMHVTDRHGRVHSWCGCGVCKAVDALASLPPQEAPHA